MKLDSQFEEIQSPFLKEIKDAHRNTSPTNNKIFNNTRKKRIELKLNNMI